MCTGASLLVLVVGKPPAIPCMPIGSTEAATPYINVPDSRFAVSEYQTLSTDDMRGFDLSKMTCIEFVTPNILAACSSTDCCLCVRLPPAPPPPTPGSRSSRRKIKDPDVSAEIKGPFPFRCVRFENAFFLERPGVTVLSMKTWFTDAAVFFVIGYADGEIAVYASKSLAETAVALNKYDPTVHEESVAIITTPQFVCSFDAYSGDNGDPSLRLPSLSIQLSEPLSLLRKTFAFELFTMERRGIVCHWGVSTKVADVKCSLLGVSLPL